MKIQEINTDSYISKSKLPVFLSIVKVIGFILLPANNGSRTSAFIGKLLT